MSNVCVLSTKIVNSQAANATNAVVQNKMIFQSYGLSFPKDTKVIFNGSVTDLLKIKLEGPREGSVTYEGDQAIRKSKELGLKPPDDADVK